MGRPFIVLMDAEASKYVCACCRAEVASGSEVTWEGWMGHGTPAILFRATSDGVDQAGSLRDEYLTSGRYTLANVHCRRCGSELGWRYLAAHDKGNSHKVGGTLIRSSKLVLQEGQASEPPNLFQPPEELPGAILATAY